MRELVIEKTKGFPAHWFLKHSFPSDKYALVNENMMLMILAECDALIPSKQSLELFHLWKGRKKINIIKKAGHNDLHLQPRYSHLIREFLFR